MHKKKLNLYGKMVLIYCFLILIPFTILLLCFYLRSVKQIENNFTSFMKENNAQLNERINMVISDIDRVSSLSIIDREVQDILGKDYKPNTKEYVNDVNTMNRLISSSSTLNSFYYEVIFIGENGQYYSNLPSTPPNKGLIEKWIPIVKRLNGQKMITDIYKGNNGTEYISINRMLLNSINFKENGFAFVNIRLEDFQRFLRSNIEKQNFFSNTIVLGDKNVIYYSKEHELIKNECSDDVIKRVNNNWREIENNKYKLTLGSEQYLLVGTTNEVTGWKIIQYIPMSYISAQSKESAYFYILTMLPILGLFIFIGYFISARIINPVYKLKKAMKNVEEGEFTTVLEDNLKQDEMGELIHSYNQMVRRLKESIYQNYIAKMNQKKVEFKMLEAQINPHFLYNTLNLISSMAELEGIDDISIISNSLSEMFRYNIKAGSIVKIGDELNQIKNYIAIQKMRFLGKFDFQYMISKDIEEYFMLKFLLQPLVENAVFHGLENKDGQGSLSIEFKEENNILIINIEDNGIGINEDILKRLNEKLNLPRENIIIEDKSEHIGIENVHFRIKDYYGENYGVKVFSKINKGTKIQLIIPVMKRGDEIL
ncbi:histidine kinase [Clostridium polyendosporum]|uniref:Histidine kinase n=1 Tax=Clostridium polyendosporum TaxID=69208 RepID=A0A919RYX9_9CLOT|nr:sensor histidine kinase [Clostridium polyendosporum]GIM28824.1 histidine kinase [Clostridium polyendosporum]